ncbi:hypothetical protein WN51_11321 [Melipona quadrifasciata]|uniref:Uncharacterized protein n=1 Tax=Melipona quadrifasciata TaxID=166423 RepID=A0A0N0BJW6_9HYME|nr:hypothetical protein WN51_11321 [Melipona quadrifasciata]
MGHATQMLIVILLQSDQDTMSVFGKLNAFVYALLDVETKISQKVKVSIWRIKKFQDIHMSILNTPFFSSIVLRRNTDIGCPVTGGTTKENNLTRNSKRGGIVRVCIPLHTRAPRMPASTLELKLNILEIYHKTYGGIREKDKQLLEKKNYNTKNMDKWRTNTYIQIDEYAQKKNRYATLALIQTSDQERDQQRRKEDGAIKAGKQRWEH